MYINEFNGNKTKMKLKGGKKNQGNNAANNNTMECHIYITDKLIYQFINPNETRSISYFDQYWGTREEFHS